MLKAKATVSTRRVAMKLQKQLESLDDYSASYGYYRQQGLHSSGMTYPELMFLHEILGVPSQGYIVRRQPFQVAAYIYKEEIAKALSAPMKRWFKNIAEDGKDKPPVEAMEKFGMMGRRVTRRIFGDPSKLAPNAPLTVKKKKGRNTPLIDTRELVNKMRYTHSETNTLLGGRQ